MHLIQSKWESLHILFHCSFFFCCQKPVIAEQPLVTLIDIGDAPPPVPQPAIASLQSTVSLLDASFGQDKPLLDIAPPIKTTVQDGACTSTLFTHTDCCT